VKFKVMEVGLPRKRIGLSMRLTDDASSPKPAEKSDKLQNMQRERSKGKNPKSAQPSNKQSSKSPSNQGNSKNSAMADAFAKLKQG